MGGQKKKAGGKAGEKAGGATPEVRNQGRITPVGGVHTLYCVPALGVGRSARSGRTAERCLTPEERARFRAAQEAKAKAQEYKTLGNTAFSAGKCVCARVLAYLHWRRPNQARPRPFASG